MCRSGPRTSLPPLGTLHSTQKTMSCPSVLGLPARTGACVPPPAEVPTVCAKCCPHTGCSALTRHPSLPGAFCVHSSMCVCPPCAQSSLGGLCHSPYPQMRKVRCGGPKDWSKVTEVSSGKAGTTEPHAVLLCFRLPHHLALPSVPQPGLQLVGLFLTGMDQSCQGRP